MNPAAVLAEAGRIESQSAAELARLRWHGRAEYERGYEAGRRDALAEEAASRREAAGLVARATAGPSHAELERRRWTLRGEHRARETFGRPHPGDYPGRDGVA